MPLSSPTPPPEPPAGTVRWPFSAHMVQHPTQDTEREEEEIRNTASVHDVMPVGMNFKNAGDEHRQGWSTSDQEQIQKNLHHEQTKTNP